MFSFRKYFDNKKEQKRISEQYALEKACVDYFNNCVPHVDDLTKLVDNIIGTSPYCKR